eukprot:6174163-Pleurochrysis_carterae.AAC.1
MTEKARCRWNEKTQEVIRMGAGWDRAKDQAARHCYLILGYPMLAVPNPTPDDGARRYFTAVITL